ALQGVGFREQLGRDRIPSCVQVAKRRVYHLDEIRRICARYNFKLLEPGLYKGRIHSGLGAAIVSYQKERDDMDKPTYDDHFRLLAPRESFQKVYDPDPILFYHLEGSYYEAVDQWGKDITIMRRVRAFFQLFTMQNIRMNGYESAGQRNAVVTIFTMLVLALAMGVGALLTTIPVFRPYLTWGWMFAFSFVVTFLVVFPIIEYACRHTDFNEADKTWKQ